MTEAELVARARDGSEAAWEALVREHQQPVFRLAYLLLADPHEAEDVTQEAFIRACRALDRFDPTLPLRPWLLSIAANLVRNRRRSVARYLNAIRRLAHTPEDTVAGPAADTVRRAEAKELWQAVRRLSAPDREIISMRYFMEMSEAETAAALGIAAGTVKSRLHRALMRLRDVVDREFPALREGRGE